jgi:hypothetical protein
MKKHAILYASAGFWYLLQLAASYYLILTLRDPGVGQTEKLLLLWFGSPGLIGAGLFFLLYFRPQGYAGLLDLGKLTLGLGVTVSLAAIVGMVVMNLARIGFAIDTRAELLILAFLGLSVLVDLAFLVLFRNRDENPPEAS